MKLFNQLISAHASACRGLLMSSTALLYIEISFWRKYLLKHYSAFKVLSEPSAVVTHNSKLLKLLYCFCSNWFHLFRLWDFTRKLLLYMMLILFVIPLGLVYEFLLFVYRVFHLKNMCLTKYDEKWKIQWRQNYIRILCDFFDKFKHN